MADPENKKSLVSLDLRPNGLTRTCVVIKKKKRMDLKVDGGPREGKILSSLHYWLVRIPASEEGREGERES